MKLTIEVDRFEASTFQQGDRQVTRLRIGGSTIKNKPIPMVIFGRDADELIRQVTRLVPAGQDPAEHGLIIEADGEWQTRDFQRADGKAATSRAFRIKQAQLITGPTVELMKSRRMASAALDVAGAALASGAGYDVAYGALEAFVANFTRRPAPSKDRELFAAELEAEQAEELAAQDPSAQDTAAQDIAAEDTASQEVAPEAAVAVAQVEAEEPVVEQVSLDVVDAEIEAAQADEAFEDPAPADHADDLAAAEDAQVEAAVAEVEPEIEAAAEAPVAENDATEALEAAQANAIADETSAETEEAEAVPVVDAASDEVVAGAEETVSETVVDDPALDEPVAEAASEVAEDERPAGPSPESLAVARREAATGGPRRPVMASQPQTAVKTIDSPEPVPAAPVAKPSPAPSAVQAAPRPAIPGIRRPGVPAPQPAPAAPGM